MKPKKINGKPVVGEAFAYDGKYKIFVCENKAEETMMKGHGYDIIPISKIEETYRKSNSFAFIDTAMLGTLYADQFETARFEYGDAE